MNNGENEIYFGDTIGGAIEESSFSHHERTVYFRKKWMKDHIWRIIIPVMITGGIIAGGFFSGFRTVCAAGPLFAAAAYLWIRSAMMMYISQKACGRREEEQI